MTGPKKSQKMWKKVLWLSKDRFFITLLYITTLKKHIVYISKSAKTKEITLFSL